MTGQAQSRARCLATQGKDCESNGKTPVSFRGCQRTAT